MGVFLRVAHGDVILPVIHFADGEVAFEAVADTGFFAGK